MWASDGRAIKKHGITDKGRSTFALILGSLATGAALRNANKAYDLAKKEFKLADKYRKMSQDWLSYYNKEFAPVEDIEIREAKELEYEEPHYEVARGRARAVAWNAYKGKLDAACKCLSRYCTGLRQEILTELTAAQADAVALADGLGYRNERSRVDNRNDTLFERKLNVAKRGRNLPTQSTSLAKASAGIYGDLWNQSWEGLRGAGYFLGYLNTRNDTFYPNVMMAESPAEVALMEIQRDLRASGETPQPLIGR